MRYVFSAGQMRRRELVTLLGGAAVAWPLAVLAQQPDRMQKKLPVIGFLASAPEQPLLDAFDRGLRERGYVEGRNILVERRFWKNDREQLSNFAAEFASERVDVIVAPTTVEALAAKQATSAIPIVTATADSLSVGLAASLARPGGNVTGLSAISDDPGKFTKGLALLAEAVPMASRFAVLMDPNNSLHAQILKGAVGAAARLHISILPVEKRTPDDIDSAFATMATNEIQAVAVLSDPVEFRKSPDDH